MKRLKKYSLATAVISMVAMPIAPVTAAEFNPSIISDASQFERQFEQGEPVWIEDNQDYRRRRFRKHRRGIRGGDILVGAAILGGIAILAGSSNRKRRDNYNRRSQQRVQQTVPQANVVSNDIGNAINLCSNAALQSAGSDYNINQIRNVSRDGDGWRVDGDLTGPTAASFACGVTAGNVQFIQLN